MAGIDLGIVNFLAGSSGESVPNPRHGLRADERIEAAQQALSRFPRRKAKDRTANHRQAVLEKVAELRVPHTTGLRITSPRQHSEEIRNCLTPPVGMPPDDPPSLDQIN
ncbi:hypothetical protein [Streptomyces umbrinus]|uniref:hypothetical protein n=1 Tax=Streptomyces umbrinus TaxID=67370 RepID=UPI00342C63C2